MSLCPQVLEEFCRKIAVAVKNLLILSLHFSLIVVWKALLLLQWLYKVPHAFRISHWFPVSTSHPFHGGAVRYISFSKALCWNLHKPKKQYLFEGQEEQQCQRSCGDCQRSSAPSPWKFATPVLAVLSSMLIGGVAESFGSCHSGASS